MNCEKLSQKLFNDSLRCKDETEMHTNLIVKHGLNKKEGTIKGLKYEWEYFGRNSGNYANVSAGNQIAILALVEKLVNSQDAVLLKFCRDEGIDPASPNAPQSVTEAVEKFFDIPEGDYSKIDWKRGFINKKGREPLPKLIHLIMENTSTTKDSPDPTISVVDEGCGIYPSEMESTILSDGESNKSRIPFLAGKYSRGGLAVLNFLGKRGIQTFTSKASPSPLNDKEKYGDHWSFTITQKLAPTQLAEYGFGENFKSSAVVYLKIDGQVPHFPQDTLKVLMGAGAGTSPRGKKKPLLIKHGTWVRMFDFQVNEKLAGVGNPSRNNAKNVMKLGQILRACVPDVAYPIHCTQPYDEGGSWNPPAPIFGLHPYLLNRRPSDKKALWCEPLDTYTQTEHGTVKTRVFLLSDEPKFHRFAGGVRGAYWKIDNQWQYIESRNKVDTTWGMSIAHNHMIITVDLTFLSADLKSQIADVSRERMRGGEVFNSLHQQIIQSVLELEVLKDFHDYLKRALLKRTRAKNQKSVVAKLLDSLQKPSRRTKADKLHAQVATDSGDLIGACQGKTFSQSELRDIISKAYLINRTFQSEVNVKTNELTLKKIVNPAVDRFRIQIGTDANMSFWNKYSIGFTSFLAEGNSLKDQSGSEVDWVEMDSCTFNPSEHGILTFTFIKDKVFNKVKNFRAKICLFPKDKALCDHPSFEFEFDCEHSSPVAPSPSTSSRAKKRSKSGKCASPQVSLVEITADQAHGYRSHYNKNKNIVEGMTEEQVIGVTSNTDGSRVWVLNTDSPRYKNMYKALKKIADLPKGEEKAILRENIFDYYECKIQDFEHSLQLQEDDACSADPVVDTSGFSHLGESDGLILQFIFRESHRQAK